MKNNGHVLFTTADWHDVNAIHYYYATRILKTIEKMGKTPIFYQETFEAAQRIHKSLPKNTIVGVWYNGEMAGIVARAGLRYSVSTLPMKMTKIFIRSNCFLRAIYMHGFYLDMVVCKKNMFSLYCSINEMICVLCLYMYSTEDTSIFKICGSQCISMYTPT